MFVPPVVATPADIAKPDGSALPAKVGDTYASDEDSVPARRVCDCRTWLRSSICVVGRKGPRFQMWLCAPIAPVTTSAVPRAAIASPSDRRLHCFPAKRAETLASLVVVTTDASRSRPALRQCTPWPLVRRRPRRPPRDLGLWQGDTDRVGQRLGGRRLIRRSRDPDPRQCHETPTSHGQPTTRRGADQRCAGGHREMAGSFTVIFYRAGAREAARPRGQLDGSRYRHRLRPWMRAHSHHDNRALIGQFLSAIDGGRRATDGAL